MIAHDVAVGEVPKMSKNQQKKAARIVSDVMPIQLTLNATCGITQWLISLQARMAAHKPVKRLEERERRKERRAELREGYANGTLSVEDREMLENRRAREKERRVGSRQQARAEGRESDGALGSTSGLGNEAESDPRRRAWGGGVIIDLGFDKLMLDQVSTIAYNRFSTHVVCVRFCNAWKLTQRIHRKSNQWLPKSTSATPPTD